MNNKKQIIIDGVNVSKCKFAITDRKEGIYLGTKCLISKSNKPYNICECNSNCYFKQRARKTQECEQKDERIIELTRAYKTLKQEYNIIKEKNKGLKLSLQEIYTVADDFSRKCEELKEKLYQIKDVVKPINEQLPEDSVIRQIMLILNDCGLGGFKTPKELELEKKLQIAEEALFFISTCVKIVKGHSLPIPTREACKAFEALQKMKEVNNGNKKD